MIPHLLFSRFIVIEPFDGSTTLKQRYLKECISIDFYAKDIPVMYALFQAS